MGTLVASGLIARASEVAQDESNVVWTTSQALEWINDGQRAVAILRPDASEVIQSIQLAPGTRQTLTGGRRLTSVIRNMGEDGLTPGYAPRLIQRDMQDEFDPNWHATAANDAGVVFEYVWDIRHPDTFYVYPPVTTLRDVYLEVGMFTNPTDLTQLTDTITISDIYGPALIEWLCYRFFSRDSEETPNLQRAQTHASMFNAMLTKKTQMDVATSPKTKEHLK